MNKTVSRERIIVGPLQIWDKLELVFEEQGKQGRYRTRIEDVSGDRMLVDRPSLLTGDALFQTGSTYVAWFIKEDSAFTFSGKVISKVDGDLGTYWVTKPTSVDRNQRRRFYRITDDSPVSIILVDHLVRQDQTEGETKVFEGIALNISGNGMLVRSKLDANIGARVLMSPRIKALKREFYLCGVIRRREKDAERQNIFHYGIEFFTIDEIRQLFSSFPVNRLPQPYLTFNEQQRTLLLNHIFTRQLEMKKKGLI